MPKVSAKALAARRSQAIKRGEALPEENDDLDPSVLSDPTYWPETEDSDTDSETDSEPNVQHDGGTPLGNQIHETSTGLDLPAKRKWRREHADILPERTTKASKTTAWRNERGKTKKARAVNMQKSVASYFTTIVPSMKTLSGITEKEREEGPDAPSSVDCFPPLAIVDGACVENVVRSSSVPPSPTNMPLSFTQPATSSS